jgi:hypothetical protein
MMRLRFDPIRRRVEDAKVGTVAAAPWELFERTEKMLTVTP